MYGTLKRQNINIENGKSGKIRENSFNPYFITSDTIRKITGEFKLLFALASLLLILNEIQIYFKIKN